MERSNDKACGAALNATSTNENAPSSTYTDCDAPDWNLVHFDVLCARCGHDLHGRSEPNCPSCQLEFDWADAVPLEKITCVKCDYHLYGLTESRCPECGESFDWNEALLDYRRKQKPLFEYRWREQPIRSLIRTWWMALRPGKFWRTIDIHDPPCVGPLLFFVCAGTVAFGIAFGASWILLKAAPSIGWWILQPSSRAFGFALDDVQYLAGRVLRGSTIILSVILVTIWTVSSLLALLIFQLSMRRHRIVTRQVVRAWAYSIAPWIAACCVLSFFARGVLERSLKMGKSGWGPGLLSSELVARYGSAILVLLATTWSIRCAYAFCLRMPRALGIALASQTIAILATLTLMFEIGFVQFVANLVGGLFRVLGITDFK